MRALNRNAQHQYQLKTDLAFTCVVASCAWNGGHYPSLHEQCALLSCAFYFETDSFFGDVRGLTHPLLASLVSPTLAVVRLSDLASGEVAPCFVWKVAKFAS